MTIDPRVGFWFSIVMAIVSALGICGTQLTTLFGDVMANKILAAIVMLNVINSAINAILHAIPSKPGAANEFPLGPSVPKLVIILAILALGTLAFPQGASAQVRRQPAINLDPLGLAKPKTAATAATSDPLAGLNLADIGKKLQTVAKDIVDKGISDLTAASTDAQNRNDKISKPCWDAQVNFLKLLPVEWQTPPTDIGPALAIQISRDLINTVTGNDDGSLKVACAALIGDQINIINQVLAVVGVQAIGLPAGL